MVTATSTALRRYCDARRKNGERCRRPAGWGTSHPGAGTCRFHGGELPNQLTAVNRAAALADARALLGQDVEGDPSDVILEGVRLARGLTLYYRRLISAHDGDVPDELARGYAEAVERQTDLAAKALRAGVAERLVRLAERAADSISIAAEEAVARLVERKGWELSVEDRALFARDFAGGLARLEERPAIEGTASE